MRALFILAALAQAGAVAAQPIDENPPTRTIQCIEVGGQSIPPVCRTPGSRLDRREDICICPTGGQPVVVSLCAKGQTPPPEGRALNVVRAAAARDGTLVGDTMDGRAICAPPRNP